MSKKNQTAFIIIFIFAAIVSAFVVKGDSRDKYLASHIKYVQIGGQKVGVELALTPSSQAEGLSGRSALPEGEGMLFVFDRPGKYLFWMKNMNFAIDMIWIAGDDLKNLRVIYIKKDAKPESYLETYGPEADAQYVLEVPSGFSEKNNVKEGDQVLFTY